MRNEFELAFNEIAEARMLDPEVVLEALQSALVKAYKHETNASAAQQVDARIDARTGRARIFVEKEVVDSVLNHHTEVDLETARYYEPEAQYGDLVMVQVERPTKSFGRIAAQTAKQVILQKVREAEREALFEEYSAKEGEIMSGVVQNITRGQVTVSLGGRAEAIMPRSQQIPGEYYKPSDKVRVLILEVKRNNRGPTIVVSRSHRNMLKRLLEYEVPEIYSGQVEIKSIAREAGGRSKVAVAALQDGIDPVGACVGMRGIRIQNIVKELHDEKIDVIEWNPDHEEFIAKALSPARVRGVYLDDDPDLGRTAIVIVPDDQLSLAIGKEGQNARLAAKLTGWRIDIKSVTESVTTGLDQIDSPELADLQETHAELIANARRIMEKKDAGLTVMPEDFSALGAFAHLVERRFMDIRAALLEARMEELNAVKQTLPEHAFDIPIEQLALPHDVIEVLMPLENAGELMLHFLSNEEKLRRMLRRYGDTVLNDVQEALDAVVYADLLGDMDDFDLEEMEDNEALETEAAEVVEVSDAAEVGEASAPATDGSLAPVSEDGDEAEDDADIVPDAAFPDEFVPEESVEPKPRRVVRRAASQADEESPAAASPTPAASPVPVGAEADEDFDDDDEDDDDKGSQKKKKERQQRRQLIYDEEIGEMVVKRRRKSGRKREDWNDYG